MAGGGMPGGRTDRLEVGDPVLGAFSLQLGDGVPSTDQGGVVADLLSPGHGQVDPALLVGLRSPNSRGLLTLGAPDGADLYSALPRKQAGRRRSVAELLDEARGAFFVTHAWRLADRCCEVFPLGNSCPAATLR